MHQSNRINRAKLALSNGGHVPDGVWEYANVYPCGSRVVPNAALPGSDYDYLIHVEPSMPQWRKLRALKALRGLLDFSGFSVQGGSGYDEYSSGGVFLSYRLGAVNLIVVMDDEFAAKHRLATRTMVHLGLLNKADRKTLFRAMLYGESDVHITAIGCTL
jgi:hypothetical protein